MTIERPKPLDLSLMSDPKEKLKQMLESTDRNDLNKYDSPLDEVDPLSLDELLNRINGEFILNNIPNLDKDIPQLVAIYQNLFDKFNFEYANGMLNKKTKTPRTSRSAATTEDLLIEDEDDLEDI